jgi:uncharacterized surface protein with fasciclin (FAS1) repeats
VRLSLADFDSQTLNVCRDFQCISGLIHCISLKTLIPMEQLMKIFSFQFGRTFGLAITLTTMLFGTSVSAEACPNSSTRATLATASQSASSGTIVDIAAGNSSFTTLVQAVQAAGLADTLSGNGPFTVFAPTNEAFAALPKGTLEKLLRPENRGTLRKVLTYHVVSGDVKSTNLRSGKVNTVEGSPVAVQVRSRGITVNNARVINADIDASNGVIHAIDRVILPPNL